jgi:metal-sulfur cluster biosynthetic enzyme
MVSRTQILTVLKKISDPEIPVNIVDLGLIYDVKVQEDRVKIKMGLTSPNCPMQSFILEDVKNKVLKIKGVKSVDIEIVNEPWSPDRISKNVKKKMGW